MNLPKQLSTKGTKNTKTCNTFILTAFFVIFVEPFPTDQVLKKMFFLATAVMLIKDIRLADR